ncbi:MAG: DUF928 domain-containing protein [Trichocoleus desertorum ATA4-8-CV12]|jgi:hypothetical protein|nr:DUF928 domain-containing protein [Trichocoleus desertorum ATA4-8-CV12]
MTHRFKRQIYYYALTVSLLMSVLLGIVPVALAKYRPPAKPSAPKGTRPNITRGGNCDRSATIGLTTLVPLSHVGQTSSQHPSFFWFMPERQAYPLQFRLFTSNGQPLYRTQLQSQAGIMQFSLPQSQPGLAIGQTYRWQVVLVCDPQAPSRNVVAAAEIEVVKPDAPLQTQLAAAATPQQQSNLYAETGLWYDAIAAALKASETVQNQSPVLDLLGSLASSEAQLLQEWSDRLKQIEAIERQRQEPQPRP